MLCLGWSAHAGGTLATFGGAWLASAPAPSAPPEGLTEWLKALAWVIGLAIGIGTLWKMVQPAKPAEAQKIEQPIGVTVAAAVKFVHEEDLVRRLGNYATNDALNEVERRLEQHAEENFRALDNKRSKSIGNLHEHLTKTASTLGEKIADSNATAAATREAIDTLKQQNASFDQKLTTILQRLPKL